MDRQPLPPSPIRPHDASGVVRKAVDAFASRLNEHDPFVAAFDHCITPMVVSDPTLPDNPLVYVNRAFEALTGFSAVEVVGRNCRFMQGPLTDQADVRRMKDAIARREPIDIDLLNHRRDGTPFWNRLMVAPVHDATGSLRYFVASQLDVTLERHGLLQLERDRDTLSAELAKREVALAEREARLALALDAGGLGTWTIDLPEWRLSYSPSCLTNFGRPVGEKLSIESMLACVHPEDRDLLTNSLNSAVEHGTRYNVEYRILTPEGEQRWIHSQGSLQRRADGTPLAVSGFSSNVSARKFAEEQRSVLAHELTHRVKNTLATVSAVVSQTLRDAASLAEARDAVSGRIASLASAHELLLKDEIEGAAIGEIVERVLAPFMDSNGRRFSAVGPTIRLTPEVTLALSMALHELATNAIKYGALSVPEGQVSIRWDLNGNATERRLTFSWAEQDGPIVAMPTRVGFGTRMIERVLSRHIRGKAEIQYLPEGVRFAIEAPI
ncbi:PAS domain S-box-containing protein [Sphingomonas faeni]|uniref:histidine kinase n=2 Tax=Sphingomonas faeni TaxID=185950 RepID=A0A2T5TWB6_9SPHN|nr:HWE histidine kinase domain-containing protein [Sphingomonas faeni]PTW43514.1 PAS domain S-box-containing protein [Sphingomonas faeni]